MRSGTLSSLTVTDGSARYSVVLRDTDDVPTMELVEKPGHQQFLEWWREYAGQMHIPYSWGAAEPQGIRIVKHLLETHSIEELKSLAVHFFLDHGDRLREDARHFALFASMLPVLKEELSARG